MDNDKQLVEELIRKTIIGLQNPTLKRSETEPGTFYSNAMLIQGTSEFRRNKRPRWEDEKERVILSAKEVGTIRILDDQNGNVYFQIDGRRMDADDVVKAFSPYVGFNLQYQIHDETEPLPEEDTLFLPVKLNMKTLTEELRELIYLFSEKHRGMMIQEKNVPAFDNSFFKLLDKLRLYYNAYPRGKGQLAGIEMIRQLEAVDTNDDTLIYPRSSLWSS